ncbi:MFS transporter [Spirochaeta cellobiosiphila]|uniref:MFS transporter n=1 Tax=Spirochaeta cellobiosiphila TaxID=504483 RepID=UPI000417FCF4|nr:MFS transporter [Spirochaeta cellobiosiphila]
MKRTMVLISGILMQIILGSVYAWSVVGKALRADYHLLSWQTELIYGIAIGVFACGTIITGRLLRVWGPKVLAIISAILFGLSFLLASFSQGHFIVLLLSLGILLGVGIAFGYVIPLSTAVAWFPHHKGLVTGLAVMGFGGGAIGASKFFNTLMAHNLNILQALLYFGILGAVILVIGSIFQAFPPSEAKDIEKTSFELSLPKGRLFWYLAISMFLASLGGLIVIGKVTSLADYYGYTAIATVALTLVTLGNATGRLLWGYLFDHLGAKSLLISTLLMTLGFLCLLASPISPVLFLIGVALTGLQFGATLVLFAAYSSRYFGIKAMAEVYPFIFAHYGIAAIIGPALGGLVYDILGSYTALMAGLTIIPVIGLVIYLGGIRKEIAKA